MVKRNVVIVDGVRTAFGRLGGGLKSLYPTELCGITIKGLVEKTRIIEKAYVDAVYVGSAWHDVHCNNFARMSGLLSGLPMETSAHFVEMQCGSGITCINHAAWQIMAGEADIIIAGGGESFSQVMAKFPTTTQPYKMISPTQVKQVLANTSEQSIDMLTVSDVMAERWNITREECDEFACRSQNRAEAAIKAGYFKEEIIPVTFPATKNTPEIVIDQDEHPRFDTKLETLKKMRPINEGGVTTAGNASGRNDGASFVLMMTEEKAAELDYKPLVRWVCSADVGVEPRVMGIAASGAILKAMKRAGLTLKDIDVLECNEAFAAQNLSVIKEIETQAGKKIDQNKWNPNGGAIAFGHPNGASGGRVGIFAMKELQRRQGRYGVFSACCGGGLGVATVIERI